MYNNKVKREVSMPNCNVSSNTVRCNCSWEPCSRKGVCCQCLEYHWRREELPACLFPDAEEKTYDRSLRAFLRIHKGKI
jgi:hypothetical protein